MCISTLIGFPPSSAGVTSTSGGGFETFSLFTSIFVGRVSIISLTISIYSSDGLKYATRNCEHQGLHDWKRLDAIRFVYPI